MLLPLVESHRVWVIAGSVLFALWPKEQSLSIAACVAETSSSYNEAIKNAWLLPDGLSVRSGRASQSGCIWGLWASDAFKGCCYAILKAIYQGDLERYMNGTFLARLFSLHFLCSFSHMGIKKNMWLGRSGSYLWQTRTQTNIHLFDGDGPSDHQSKRRPFKEHSFVDHQTHWH